MFLRSPAPPVRRRDDGTYIDVLGVVIDEHVARALPRWDASQDPGPKPFQVRISGAGSPPPPTRVRWTRYPQDLSASMKDERENSFGRRLAEWQYRHDAHEQRKRDEHEREKDRDAERLARAFGFDAARRRQVGRLLELGVTKLARSRPGPRSPVWKDEVYRPRIVRTYQRYRDAFKRMKRTGRVRLTGSRTRRQTRRAEFFLAGTPRENALKLTAARYGLTTSQVEEALKGHL